MNPQQPPLQPTPPIEPQQPPVTPPAYQQPQQPAAYPPATPQEANPAQPAVVSQPQVTATPVEIKQPARKSHKKLGLTLLITPTALIILGILLYMVSSMIPREPSEDGFGDTTPIGIILNVLCYVCGALGFITWLPALIIGIILLVKKK